MTERQPLEWAKLNYKGDLRNKIEGNVIGPNQFGERFVILATEYNLEKDLTTARLAYATTDDLKRNGIEVVTP